MQNSSQSAGSTRTAGSDTPVADLVNQALNIDGSVRDAKAFEQLQRLADGAK